MNTPHLLCPGKLKVDLGMLAQEAQTLVVYNLLHCHGFRRQTHVFELELAVTKLVVSANVVVLDGDMQHHIVEIWNISKLEGLSINRVQVILLLTGLHLSVSLVEGPKVVLFEVELDVRVALACRQKEKSNEYLAIVRGNRGDSQV